LSDIAEEAEYTQDNRLLAIETPLGKDKVLLTEVDGRDEISRGFIFNIEIATQVSDTEVRSLLGKPVTLWLSNQIGAQHRPVNGLIRKLSGPLVNVRGFRIWRAEVVPRFWFLSCTADCRIFQDMSIPDIIKAVFKTCELTDYEIRGLRGNYPKLDYCVQYRETAFDFVSRLMEHVGMFYWHEHSEDKHLLVISDNNSTAKPALVDRAVLNLRPDLGHIQTLEHEYAFRPGKWTLNDYDFRTPSKRLLANAPTTLDVHRMAQHEIFDWPGLYQERDVGSQLTRIRIELEEMQHHRLHGEGSTSGFDAGRTISITSPDGSTAGGDDKFLLTEIGHRAADRSYITNETTQPHYTNRFTAIPTKVPFRPERVTEKPFVRGPQTAMVTGPSGESIYTDKHGRVKVRFHWDRNPDSNKDESSSCWLRVSQVWADKDWGAIHIPRIGQEVIVDFLEGDPDRPIITGRVYNGDKTVPYPLPANATQSGIKSHTVKGSGSNELRFEDKQRSEEVWLHAQKDLNAKVENDETREVGHDRKTTVHNNETTTIDVNKETTVTGNFSEKVTGTETRNVTGNVSETFAANETRTIGGNVTETITGSLTQTVTGGIKVTTPGAIMTVATGGWTLIAPGGTRTVDTFFDKTGGAYITAFGLRNAFAGMQINNTGLLLANILVKMEANILKVERVGVLNRNTPLDIEQAATKIKQGTVALYMRAISLFL